MSANDLHERVPDPAVEVWAAALGVDAHNSDEMAELAARASALLAAQDASQGDQDAAPTGQGGNE